MKARTLREVAAEKLKQGPLEGDMVVAYAENPHQMMRVMVHSAVSTGSTIVIRNGNSPELEYSVNDKGNSDAPFAAKLHPEHQLESIWLEPASQCRE